MEYEKLSDNRAGETSVAIRARVEAARKRQRERFTHTEGVTCSFGYRPDDAPRAILHRVNWGANLYVPTPKRNSPENGTATYG